MSPNTRDNLTRSERRKLSQGRTIYPPFTEDPPTREESGVFTRDATSVHVVFFAEDLGGSDPVYVVVRPWRFYATVRHDETTGLQPGVWVHDYPVTVPVNEAARLATNASQHYVWDVRDADKMHWQIVSLVGGGPTTQPSWVRYQAFVYTDSDDDLVAVASSSSSCTSGSQTEASMSMPLSIEDSLWSNLRGDFSVSVLDAQTLTLSHVYMPWVPSSGNIYAVGKRTALEPDGILDIRYRGIDLRVTFDPDTWSLGFPDEWFGEDDIPFVWIEGPPRAYNHERDSKRVITDNPDAKHNSADGVIKGPRFQLVGPEEAGYQYEYVPFNMAQDGFHSLTAQITVEDDGENFVDQMFLTLEATNDLEPDDADCVWTNVFLETFNHVTHRTGINGAVSNLALVACTGIHWRRMRWVIRAETVGSESPYMVGGGKVTIKQTRTTYDAPRTADFYSQGQLAALRLSLIDSLAESFSAPVTHWSPVDGSVAYASATTLTASGFPFTVDDSNCIVQAIDVIAAGGEVTRYVNGQGGISISASSNTISLSGAPSPFDATDSGYVVYITEQTKTYDVSSDSFRTTEQNPLDEKYVRENLVETTTYAKNTTTYYPYNGDTSGLSMDGYKDCWLEFQMTGAAGTTVTLTVEATLATDTLVAGDWVDITSSCLELSTYNRAASWATGAGASVKGILRVGTEDGLNVRYVRFKVVSSNNNDNSTVILDVRRRAL